MSITYSDQDRIVDPGDDVGKYMSPKDKPVVRVTARLTNKILVIKEVISEEAS